MYSSDLSWLPFVVAIGLAFIPASIAKSKGRSFGGYWVLGFFFFLIALIIILCMDPKPEYDAYNGSTRDSHLTETGQCSECGAPNPPGRSACVNCGAKFSSKSAPQHTQANQFSHPGESRAIFTSHGNRPMFGVRGAKSARPQRLCQLRRQISSQDKPGIRITTLSSAA